jgi:hypothetical protein
MKLMSATTGQEPVAANPRLPARDRQVIGILLVAAFVVISQRDDHERGAAAVDGRS